MHYTDRCWSFYAIFSAVSTKVCTFDVADLNYRWAKTDFQGQIGPVFKRLLID